MTETTVEYARLRIQELEAELSNTKVSLESARDMNHRIDMAKDNLAARINKARIYLVENFSELEEHATELASLLEVELDIERDLQVYVTFNLRVTASPEMSEDDIVGSLNFSATGDWGDVEVIDDEYEVTGSSMEGY